VVVGIGLVPQGKPRVFFPLNFDPRARERQRRQWTNSEHSPIVRRAAKAPKPDLYAAAGVSASFELCRRFGYGGEISRAARTSQRAFRLVKPWVFAQS
jgi:hypothetical protein